MNAREAESWHALRVHIAALRQANSLARTDVPRSGYDVPSTLERVDEKCRRLGVCESRISEALANNSVLTWWIKRQLLGKYCREVFTWFDRSTDDNFNWTQQADAISARDEVARCLKTLGF